MQISCEFNVNPDLQPCSQSLALGKVKKRRKYRNKKVLDQSKQAGWPTDGEQLA